MDYDRDLHRNYFDGRALGASTRRLWMDVVGEYLPAGAETILDLGCGTGRFTLPMMERFPVRVVGVDPSRRMLVQVPPGPLLARAPAERIPLRVVRQETDESLAAHFVRLRKRAMSTFALLTEEEIQAGLAAVADAVRAEREPAPVVEGIDLLVLEKR